MTIFIVIKLGIPIEVLSVWQNELDAERAKSSHSAEDKNPISQYQIISRSLNSLRND